MKSQNKTDLPTKAEWNEAGFDVPAELCSDQPPVAGHKLKWKLLRDITGQPITYENGLALKIALGPIHYAMVYSGEATAELLASAPRLARENEALVEALKRIEKWEGEFPASGRTWQDGSEMSYSAAFGSNGERDYMREVARAALALAGKEAKL